MSHQAYQLTELHFLATQLSIHLSIRFRPMGMHSHALIRSERAPSTGQGLRSSSGFPIASRNASILRHSQHRRGNAKAVAWYREYPCLEAEDVPRRSPMRPGAPRTSKFHCASSEAARGRPGRPSTSRRQSLRGSVAFRTRSAASSPGTWARSLGRLAARLLAITRSSGSTLICSPSRS